MFLQVVWFDEAKDKKEGVMEKLELGEEEGEELGVVFEVVLVVREFLKDVELPSNTLSGFSEDC